MNLKDFSNLIEIQSLQNQIKKHLDEINIQEGRITYLEKKKKQTQSEMQDLQKELNIKQDQLTQEEKALNLLEKRLSTLSNNRMQLKTNEQLIALEKEFSLLTNDKTKLEDRILEQIDMVSKIEEQLAISKSFVNGVDKSICEIKKEVDQNVHHEKSQIINYQERIDELTQLIPKEAREIFMRVNQKYLYNHPITLIQNQACARCNYPIDRNLASLIEKGTMLELCPGCERLIAPHSAQYLSS